MKPITVFGDVGCPFTYVGLSMLIAERDERAVDLRVRVRAWPLEWVNGKPLDPNHVEREIAALRTITPTLFQGFDPSTFPRTSIPAFGLIDAAYRRSEVGGEAAALAVRAALFEQGADIADPAVLAPIADRFEVSLPTREAARTAIQRDYEDGRALGVVGSPHFVSGDRGWFCPALQISQHDGQFDVTIDEAAKAEFFASVFSS
jgi:predicted DsbA family dithiol-disulfide isomerase